MCKALLLWQVGLIANVKLHFCILLWDSAKTDGGCLRIGSYHYHTLKKKHEKVQKCVKSNSEPYLLNRTTFMNYSNVWYQRF